MDNLINSAVSLQAAKTFHSANIAVIKAQNEMTEALIDMVSESIESSRMVSASTKGRNVDVSI